MDALIGYTGFIGSILKKDISGDFFNSENISKINEKSYDVVYFAGVHGVKWVANKNPKEDKENIDNLYEFLKNTKCKKLILISTISVYDNEPYGINRKNFEDRLLSIFKENILIIRLPAVFGDGIKKNLLFDMLNDKVTKEINILDTYQWYNVNQIKSDIDKFMSSNEKIIEFYPEPISNRELVQLFKKKFSLIEDIKSCYIQNIKPKNGYIYNSNKVINDLKKFIDGYR